eukprot:SAG11_NODE_2257_length_3613_cov_1.750996_5_plen_205_part_00
MPILTIRSEVKQEQIVVRGASVGPLRNARRGQPHAFRLDAACGKVRRVCVVILLSYFLDRTILTLMPAQLLINSVTLTCLRDMIPKWCFVCTCLIITMKRSLYSPFRAELSSRRGRRFCSRRAAPSPLPQPHPWMQTWPNPRAKQPPRSPAHPATHLEMAWRQWSGRQPFCCSHLRVASVENVAEATQRHNGRHRHEWLKFHNA